MPHRAPILVVDDDEELRLLLATFLEAEGESVITAADGQEAFAAACVHTPCLIVLDLMMPRLTGEEFRRAQLAEERIRDIPVVVVSARYDVSLVAERMHVAGWVQKPIDFDDLQHLIMRFALT